MKRDLDADAQMLRTVLDLAQKREFRRAAEIADRAIAEGFEHPLLLNVVASRLEQQGRFDDSLKLLERAVTVAPQDFGARHALALCLQRLNRPADALPHISALIAAHPSAAVAHVSLGNALIALGELARAREALLRALELEPSNVAAMAALASIGTHRGDHDEARRWAKQVLAILPGYPDAVMSLAAAELASGETELAISLLRGPLADPRASTIDKARARGLLGDALDAGGRYAEAFDAYEECNTALRQLHRRFASDPTMVEYSRRLLAALDAMPVAERSTPVPSASPAAAEHVFLVGFPRSGTTLLEVALDGHPRVVSAEELELLGDAVSRYMAEPSSLQELAGASESELEVFRKAYWARVRAASIHYRDKVFIDKYPLNTLKLPLIARLFPSAKILFVLRDPRDVVLSCFRRRFRMNQAMYQLLTIVGAAEFYAVVMEVAEAARGRLNMAWYQLRYEDLVRDFEGELRRICDFVGVEWAPAVADFAGRAAQRAQATPSTAQLSEGLRMAGTSHFRNYAGALAPAMPFLQPWISRFGYTA